jgi:hypothetical protein
VGAEHFEKTGRMAQMEITPLEGDNVFSGGRKLHTLASETIGQTNATVEEPVALACV